MLPALLLAAAAASAAPAPSPTREVAFQTRDGWTIAALYRPPRRGRAVAVLAHGVASSKGEWGPLVDALARKGVGTLAIDLRGHYQSRRGPRGERCFESFSAEDWNAAVEDLAAAARWLEARGIPAKKIGLGGASIGANLAAAAAAKRPKTPFLLLLSAGAEYRGVRLVRPPVKTLAGAAPGDPAVEVLPALARAGAETFRAPAGHGVRMFDDPATLDKVAEWIAAAGK